MPTLLLLTGSELVQWPTAQVTYTREGSMSDMFLPLMAHVGRRVRVVRGPLLESMFAPQAGVRYDGEYASLPLTDTI